MFYLITQILLCLLAAFLLGVVITWFFMRGVRDRAAQEMQAQTVVNTGKLETELAAAKEGMERFRDRSRALEKDLASLRERMETVRRQLELEKQSAGDDTKRVRELKAQATEFRAEAEKAAQAAKEAASRAGELDALVNSQKGKLVSLEEEVAGLADLRRELDAVNATLRQRDDRIRQLERDAEMRTATVTDSTWQDRVRNLESTIGDRDAQIGALTVDLRKARDQYRAALQRKDEELAALRAQRPELRTAAQARSTQETRAAKPRDKRKTATRTPKRDDLKRIKGIGVVLERVLHKNGVHTFEQIAQWSRDDIDRVDAKLGKFKGRIRRDKWVVQAKKLNKE